MNIRKFLALMLALMLTLTGFACAETASTEETPEHNYQVITDPVIITCGEREIHVSDAMSRFLNYYQTLNNYQSYGIDASGYVSIIKETVLNEMAQDLIEEIKISELGYDQFTEEEMAEIDEQVKSTYSEVYVYYYNYFTYNAAPDADIDAMVKEALEYYDYTEEDIRASVEKNYAANKMAEDLTKDVVVTEEDLQDYFYSLVSEDETAYSGTNIDAYDQARAYNSDSFIAWNPTGYRRVLQVLIKFDDDSKAEYAQLKNEHDILVGLVAPQDGYVPTMTLDEVNARMKEITDPMMVTANEVTEKFGQGVSIQDLMIEYSGDVNTPEEGYYVCAQSALYDPAFVDAAFSVREKGELSAPFAGEHGLYMVYYLDDVPAGPVDIEPYREQLTAECLDYLKRDAYFAKLSEWKIELGVETNIDMFITGYEG